MRRLILPVLFSPFLLLFFVCLTVTVLSVTLMLGFGTLYCWICGPNSKAALLVASMQGVLKDDEP